MRHSGHFLAVVLPLVCHTSTAFLLPVDNAGVRSSSGDVLRSIRFNRATIEIKPSPMKTRSAMTLSSKVNSVEDSDSPAWSFNPLFASLWIGFFAFAAFGPGEIGAASDTQMITDYIANPADPGFSEGFQLIFNYLGIMPIIIACTAVPQAAQRGLPPLPFLVSSFAMGYGGVGTLSFFVTFLCLDVFD